MYTLVSMNYNEDVVKENLKENISSIALSKNFTIITYANREELPGITIELDLSVRRYRTRKFWGVYLVNHPIEIYWYYY